MTKTFWFFRCCLAQPTLQTPPCTSVPLIRGGSSHSNYQGTGVQGYRGGLQSGLGQATAGILYIHSDQLIFICYSQYVLK